MSLHTVNDVFSGICERRRDRVMMQREASDWVPISSADLYRNVVGVGRALESWGIGKGDRVGILSENRPEWTIADFAILSIGAVTVPIYATQTAEQCAYILKDSGTRVLVVSTKAQLEKALAVRQIAPVERIIVMDAVADSDAVCMRELMLSGPSGADSKFDARAAAVAPDDLATVIYTSGTTGTPKGAMLTHGNLASNIACSLAGIRYRSKEG